MTSISVITDEVCDIKYHVLGEPLSMFEVNKSQAT